MNVRAVHTTDTEKTVFGRLLESFPPPSFLDVPVAGVEVSHSAVKVFGLTRVREGYVPDFFEERRIAAGVVDNGEVHDTEALVKELSALRQKHGMHFIRASLPEEKAYLFQTTVPSAESDKQIRSSIEFRLEEYVPIPPQESIFDYDIIAQRRENTEVSITVYPKAFILNYQEMLVRAGFTPVAFELEGQAIANAVVPRGDERTYMIIDFGRTRSSITIVKNGIVSFTSTINVSGNAITDAIVKHRNVSEAEADTFKNTKGLSERAGDGELHRALTAVVDQLRGEIERHVLYWNNKDENRKAGDKVHTILLCGGNASLKGLPEYIASGVKVPTELADVWQNVFSYDDYIPSLSRERSLSYATAIGLALA